MLGIVTLGIALFLQIVLMVFQLVKKNRLTRGVRITRISGFAVFSLLLSAGVYWRDLRWAGLFTLLAVQAVAGAARFLWPGKREKPWRPAQAVASFAGGCALMALAILPGILFPQFAPVTPSGPYAVNTKSCTLVDESRADPYSATGENRKLTVEFWYPDAGECSDRFPLVVFSHGAFGYRGSNRSTFEELASHGYVVCSIDHSHHAFFARHTDGSVTPVDMGFLNDAIRATDGAFDARKTYEITHEWQALRAGDMNFVLDEILKNARTANPETVYSLIDPQNIGLFGHSLGGATAAALGRTRGDVDAVMVLDGTMFGEETGFENGHAILNPAPYPVPLFTLYNQSHYADALAAKETYANLYASGRAANAWNAVVRGSGHLNFTDLPLFSPALAKMLGTGTVDSRYCIETMNGLALKFFDYALKKTGTVEFRSEY